MLKYSIVVGLDPGIYGGLCILEKNKEPLVYKIPLKDIIINKKKKKEYDLIEIVKILKPYMNKNVLFIQERVGVHSGEGSVSGFGFGRSSGFTLGIAYALGFAVIEITPQRWKKHFPELINDIIREKKKEVKELREEGKILKDKEEKKQNKRQIDKLNRKIKAEAKSLARELASKKYPGLKDKFEKKNTDGLAESLLIGIFGKDNKSELV